MKQFLLILFVFSFIAFPNLGFSQKKINKKAQKYFDEAVDFYRQKQFEEAVQSADKAIEKQPDFVKPFLLKGEVGIITKNYLLTIQSMEAALELSANPDPKIYYTLGSAEFSEGLYEDAKGTLGILKNLSNLNPDMREKAEFLYKNAEFAAWAIKNPVPFNPENLGQGVNSLNADYHPCLTVDGKTLIFTRREYKGEDRYGRPIHREDFYTSELENGNWKPALNLGPPINTEANEGAQSVSMDGRYMYFTACHRPDGVGSCDIYRAKYTSEGWKEPENLGKNLNARAWDSQPSISADGKTLYFTSSRSGGKGKKDIWMSVLDEYGEWSTPQSVSFNTKYNEQTPLIHPDGKTLYFSSDGYPGMGGMDVFYVRKQDDGTWGEPVNVGYPINTYNDEHGLVVDAQGEMAYFASDREVGFGYLDIYSFELYEDARPNPVSYTRGLVRDAKTKKGVQAKIEIVELTTEQVVASAISDELDGTYIIALPENTQYAANVTAEGYLFQSEQFIIDESSKKDFSVIIDLEKINVGKTVVLKNIFYETGSFELMNTSRAELNKLVNFLEKNSKLKIEIGGHTDNIGSEEDNQILSENRAKSVYNYLIKSGIAEERLSYKGYGQNKPIDTNETEQGRANNRRTEFRVVGV